MRNAFIGCLMVSLWGCAHVAQNTNSACSLIVESYSIDQVVFPIDCHTVVCTDGFANEGFVWITDLSEDALRSGEFNHGQIVQIQLLWIPEAGKTPLSETSTNFVFEHIIISNGEIGVYGGGGYCWPSGNAQTGITLDVEDATIALQEKSERFVDLLSPSTISGVVRSQPNAHIARLIEAAAQRIKNQ